MSEAGLGLSIEGQDVKIEEERATWELSADELIYSLGREGKKWKLLVHMRPYNAYDMKQYRAESRVKLANEGGANLKIISSDAKKTRELFWKYFIRLSNIKNNDGSELSSEEQKKFIQEHEALQIESAVVEGLFSSLFLSEPKAEEEESDEEDSDVFVIDSEKKHSVSVHQFLWDARLKLDRRVDMTHWLRPETTSDLRRYETATGSTRLNTSKKEWQKAINYDLIEQLYDSMIESVEGMTLNGEACQSANKEQWLKLVPFHHKDVVITQVFSGVQTKNA